MGRAFKYTSKLTQEQQDLITQHYKMIYRVTKYWFDRTNLSFEDCYDASVDAIIYTARIFDKEKGFKFSTLYYRLTNKAVLKKIRDNKADMRVINQLTISLESKAHASDEDNFKVIDTITYQDVYSIYDQDEIARAWKVLKETEKKYIYLSFYKQMSQMDIGKYCSAAKTNVGRAINKGLGKLKDELERLEMSI